MKLLHLIAALPPDIVFLPSLVPLHPPPVAKLTVVHMSRVPWRHQCKYTGTGIHLSRSGLGSTSWICKNMWLKY